MNIVNRYNERVEDRKYNRPNLTGLIPESYIPQNDPDYIYKTAPYANGMKQVTMLTYEEFRPYPPNPRYLISNLGRLYSTITNKMCKGSMVKGGYIQYTLRDENGVPYKTSAHRMVLEAFDPIPNPEEMQVNHLDGFTHNNFFITKDNANLKWSTLEENIEHAFNTGLRKRSDGQYNPTATMTNEEAEKICQLMARGFATWKIAEIMGIPYDKKFICRLSMIRMGLCWKEYAQKYGITVKYHQNRKKK